MRFINNSSFTPPVDWDAKVSTAKIRYNLTGQFTSIWRDLANELNSLVRSDKQRKCWYSEVIVLGSDIDVDHFRPKSNVKGLTKKFATLEEHVWTEINQDNRAGYSYLAFDWKNFRLSSQHSNQGRIEGQITKGKQDFFPLKKTSPVAMVFEDLDSEEIGLLDPCKKGDPDLLRFSAGGEVDTINPTNSWDYCRAKITIELYHLNFNLKGLVDARLQIWNECTREIEFFIKLFNTKKVDLIIDQQRKIFQLTKTSSSFSAVAIDCIRHYALQKGYAPLLPIANKLHK